MSKWLYRCLLWLQVFPSYFICANNFREQTNCSLKQWVHLCSLKFVNCNHHAHSMDFLLYVKHDRGLYAAFIGNFSAVGTSMQLLIGKTKRWIYLNRLQFYAKYDTVGCWPVHHINNRVIYSYWGVWGRQENILKTGRTNSLRNLYFSFSCNTSVFYFSSKRLVRARQSGKRHRFW